MLIIDTYLKMVEGKGIGLFATECICSGQSYWTRNIDFDIIRTAAQIALISKQQIQFVHKYGFLEVTGNWYICVDNARFCNHSFHANTGNRFNHLGELIDCFAICDILPGEEIVCNYQDFCQMCRQKLGFTPID